MKFPVNRRQFTAVDMSINLRRTDICMTEHFLNHPQISSIRQQMRGKRMTKGVRMNIFRNAGTECRILYDRPNPFPVKFTGTAGNKQIRDRRIHSGQFQPCGTDIFVQ